ncbi:MAG TPA: hypothetical protein VF385_01760 [Patescibacteria group bacterium]
MKLSLKIELSDKIKKEITDQLSGLKKIYPQFRWEPIEKYSVLIHTFGESFNSKAIIKKLELALFDKKLFYLYAYEISLTIGNKITLYLDFRREKEVERISKGIKEEFQITQSLEKYVPRLMIANYKIPSKQQYFVIKKRLTNLDIDISFKINKLGLFEGEKKIHSFKLL